MLKHILLAALSALPYSGFGRQPEKSTTSNDVVIPVTTPATGSAKQVRVRAIDDNIIRITATRQDTFADGRSLIVGPQNITATIDITESDTSVAVATAALRVIVDRRTGGTVFQTVDGAPLLAETAGGPQFTPYEAGGKQEWSIAQRFHATPGEGFYGLGQHQADEWNYSGKNEELFQYNTKVSLPMIVSSRGYGLLWDCYSLCRWGDERPYSPLGDIFTLYDRQGNPGSLTGTYISALGDTLIRPETSIGFEDIFSIQALPENFKLDGARVTYEGELEPAATGLVHFSLYYAGYTRVYINEEPLVAERWRTSWNPNSYKFTCPAVAGRRLRLRIEWQPDGGTSYCALRALPPVEESRQRQPAFWQEMNPELDYYFIGGGTADKVIAGYRRLTGRAPIMPRWAMGFWQSRERYKTQQELLSTLDEFRRRRFPIDNIVQDWSYWPEESWGSHEFDPARFPDPKGMIDSVHARNARFMISVWPKFYVTTDHYKELDAQGWMYRRAVEDSIRDWIGRGYLGSFYDAYAPGARRLFWQQMRDHLFPLGVDAWWMDASEPNVRDCTPIDYRKALCGPTALGPSDEYFNAYALMNAEAIYNGQREADPDRRVFLLTRSGFAGLQRYSTATWSGDIGTRWEDMKAQISAGLNFSIGGIPFWTMDIGGFCVERRYEKAQKLFDKTGRENDDLREWRELNARWFQFGAFVPLYRAHGQFPKREPWHIAPDGHPAYRSILYYTRLRYALMPYLYSMAGAAHHNDYTLMRPLVMDFPTDTAALNIGDQYLFGPSLMVCPVYRYQARTRDLYFPAGRRWYDFYSGRQVSGQGGHRATVDAPYERIPLFVPGGAILVTGPDLQYAGEKPLDEATVYLYAGCDGSFTLYEDDGTTYGYERGAYCTTELTYDDTRRTLTIGRRQGSYPGMVKQRTFRIVYITPDAPHGYGDSGTARSVRYSGKSVRIRL